MLFFFLRVCLCLSLCVSVCACVLIISSIYLSNIWPWSILFLFDFMRICHLLNSLEVLEVLVLVRCPLLFSGNEFSTPGFMVVAPNLYCPRLPLTSLCIYLVRLKAIRKNNKIDNQWKGHGWSDEKNIKHGKRKNGSCIWMYWSLIGSRWEHWFFFFPI